MCLLTLAGIRLHHRVPRCLILLRLTTTHSTHICRPLPHQQAARRRVNLSTHIIQVSLRLETCLREGLKRLVLSTTALLPTSTCRPVCPQEPTRDRIVPALDLNPYLHRCSPWRNPRLVVETRRPVLAGPARLRPETERKLLRTMDRSSVAVFCPRVFCPRVFGRMDDRWRVPGHSRPILSATSPTKAMVLSSRTRQTPPISHPTKPNLCLSPWHRRHGTICRQTPKRPIVSQSNTGPQPHLWLQTASCPRRAAFLQEAASHHLQAACLLQRCNSPP